MMIRPYKPRDSARSVLLTAVHDQLPGLAVHPQGFTTLRHLTGAADTYGLVASSVFTPTSRSNMRERYQWLAVHGPE